MSLIAHHSLRDAGQGESGPIEGRIARAGKSLALSSRNHILAVLAKAEFVDPRLMARSNSSSHSENSTQGTYA